MKVQPGRIPHWPAQWLDLADKVGGSAKLRVEMGYSSKSTISNKIHGRTPWSRADLLLILAIIARVGMNAPLVELVGHDACFRCLLPKEYTSAGVEA